MTPSYKRNTKLLADYFSENYTNVRIYTDYKTRKFFTNRHVPLAIIRAGTEYERVVVCIFSKNKIWCFLKNMNELEIRFPYLRFI